MKLLIRAFIAVLFISISCHYISAHDLLVGKFTLLEKPNGYDLSIRLDRDNVLLAIRQECPTFGNNDTKIKNYVYDHFTLSVDGQDLDYELSSYESDKYFVVLKGFVGFKKSDFQNLEVWNTCMVETIKEQSNIISISRSGKKRSFRLSKDRHRTVITY